ncbi:hypothetical protein BU16DRAFT_564532 [Lophium mytilinum]|uniref:Uncharacterized protein n=1 Tax=Lophium mytilinum TaxID=390894 RepID=A0A6A6QJ60_9PEZI|nr:hypothetical protein BU16DRAFT_564532 [Lophium mytilinum]
MFRHQNGGERYPLRVYPRSMPSSPTGSQPPDLTLLPLLPESQILSLSVARASTPPDSPEMQEVAGEEQGMGWFRKAGRGGGKGSGRKREWFRMDAMIVAVSRPWGDGGQDEGIDQTELDEGPGLDDQLQEFDRLEEIGEPGRDVAPGRTNTPGIDSTSNDAQEQREESESDEDGQVVMRPRYDPSIPGGGNDNYTPVKAAERSNLFVVLGENILEDVAENGEDAELVPQKESKAARDNNTEGAKYRQGFLEDEGLTGAENDETSSSEDPVGSKDGAEAPTPVQHM